MTKKDAKLGMGRDITRRDFLNGASIAVGGSLLPHQLLAQNSPAQSLPDYYPPALTGMRGSHPGSFEVGHRVRDGDSFQGIDTGENYDLVVVGGGISGLTAAYATGKPMARAVVSLCWIITMTSADMPNVTSLRLMTIP